MRRLGLLAAALALGVSIAPASEFENPMVPSGRGFPITPGAGGPMKPGAGHASGGGGGGTNLLDFSVAANSQYFGVIGP